MRLQETIHLVSGWEAKQSAGLRDRRAQPRLGSRAGSRVRGEQLANSIASVRQLPYALKVAATQQRIEARISADEKRLLKDAAQRRGMTLTAFVLSTAHDAAVRTLETAHVVELTRQDQQRFVDTLLNPPAPSERLRAAATDYREHRSRATNKSRR